MTEQQARARVIKAKDRPKPGVITVEKAPGQVVYRCPCDVCDTFEEVSFLPRADRVFHCRICRKIATRGKESTYYSKKEGQVRYHTDCDRCENSQETTFLPGRDRLFLCDSCMREERKQNRSEKPVKFGVKSIGTQEEPRFLAPCDSCKKKVEVAFAPRQGETFQCSSCFGTQRQRAVKRREKPDTRIMFNIECYKCGRSETLGFIPSQPEVALCTQCLPKKEWRK